MTTAIRASLLVAAAGVAACGGTEFDPASDVTMVTQPLVIQNTQIGSGGPGGAYFGNTVHLTYTGTDGHLNILRFPNGPTANPEKQTLAERSNYGSALWEHGGELYLCWVGLDGAVNLLRSSDGWSFPTSTKRTTNFQGFSGEPSLVAYNGFVRAWVRGSSTTVGSYMAQWGIVNGELENWGTILENISGSPSAAILGSELVLAWVGPDGNLRTKKHNNSVGWLTTNVRFFKGVPHVWTASIWPPTLMMAFRKTGEIGPNQIEFWKTTDALNWTFVNVVGHTTGTRPLGLAANSSFVEYLHRGTDSSQKLNWNSFNM
jgi:hypothetical protein